MTVFRAVTRDSRNSTADRLSDKHVRSSIYLAHPIEE